MEKVRYMISDAATMVGVETHVLRYWEEELELTIPRNEMGHRYYTRDNIQEFQKIRELKEKGYQLKAIRTILHTGKTPAAQPTPPAAATQTSHPVTSATPSQTPQTEIPAAIAPSKPDVPKELPVNELSAEERMAQFRELMSEIVGKAIALNNEELSQNIGQEVRETVLKEMNYLFREQEESEEERYKKLDAAIRGKLKKKHSLFSKKEKPEKTKKVRQDAVSTT